MEVFELNTKVISGVDCLKYFNQYKNKGIFIVCDKFLAENQSITKILKEIDDSNKVELFTDVVPDPPLEEVAAGMKRLMAGNCDVIVAFGGGSAIDAAKAILFFTAKQTGKVFEFIAIPTTSGTGSDATAATVITDLQAKVKHLFADPMMLPAVALLNPDFTRSVPKPIVANTGIDVLTHALEAYVAQGRDNFSDCFAEKSVQIITQSLLITYNDPDNTYHREQMQVASTMAGMAFNKAGLGINHGIAHNLGGMFHIPHGLANAILLPHVVTFNSRDDGCLNRYAQLAKVTGISPFTDTSRNAVDKLIAYIRDIMKKMEMPTSLIAWGMDRNEFEAGKRQLAENALVDTCTQTTPLMPTAEEVLEILNNISK
ncbi:iron-containing alcohol dehydrogenase [Eubacterium limosum]|nr:iron-containing alcohol dehydrogenase [Eubacterium limosum]